MKRQWEQYVADFETTVFDGQEYTEVWAGALVKIWSEDVKIYHSIDEFFNAVFKLKGNIQIYFHNLKFDGSFIIPYLIKEGFEIATDDDGHYIAPRFMKNKSFQTVISDMGMWYKIIIRYRNKIYEIRDSLKLLPFSVQTIGNCFETKHKKLHIEYEGLRYAGCEITPLEEAYIKNDVLVVKEALEILFKEGHNRLTIGSCCLSEFKAFFHKDEYDAFFPDLYEIPLDADEYGSENAFEYVRKSYHGGWCYLAKGKSDIIYHNGLTLDVNSLYPSMMHSSSGNKYPIGKPRFWKGDIPPEALENDKYYFIRFKCRFYLKENHLPFIQLKNNMFYKQNECLETSDIVIRGKSSPFYYDNEGNLVEHYVTLTMTMTDYKLFREHYNVYNLEVLDGCYFYTHDKLFDNYINKYYEIKQNSKGAKRTLAKLFLNNLYGKMASTRCSNYRVPFVKGEELIGYVTVKANDKEAGYIPIGSAITSYARNFTIRTAQANYKHFIYADTDSIHMLKAKPKNITISDTELSCWKLEKQWDTGLFVRQKTYIEIEDGDIDVKCAGMPDTSKRIFIEKMKSGELELSDFKKGLVLGGKLVPKQIKGGVILCETSYEIR